jgi:NADPH:quinone reductase-like Zn-dependent oxidoreductase
MFRGAITSCFGKRKVLSGVIKERAEDMQLFKRMIEAKTLVPVIDSTFSLSQIAQAHAKVDTGHKRGNVIVTMNELN